MIEPIVMVCRFVHDSHLCSSLDRLDNLGWLLFLLPQKVSNVIHQYVFSCTCGHPYESHSCDCGVTYCAECPVGEYSTVRFHHELSLKDVCHGSKR